MPVEELTQVVLDGECQSQTIVGLDSLTACEELSIQGCGIASLDNFPNLQALRKLLLADNRIGGGLENLAKLTNLEELSIGGNKVASLDELKPLVNLKLTAIDLEGCPCADGSDTYRSAVFAMWPSLVFLDGTDVDGNERLIDDEDSEDEDEDEEEDFDDDDEEDEDDFDDEEDETTTTTTTTTARSRVSAPASTSSTRTTERGRGRGRGGARHRQPRGSPDGGRRRGRLRGRRRPRERGLRR